MNAPHDRRVANAGFLQLLKQGYGIREALRVELVQRHGRKGGCRHQQLRPENSQGACPCWLVIGPCQVLHPANTEDSQESDIKV